MYSFETIDLAVENKKRQVETLIEEKAFDRALIEAEAFISKGDEHSYCFELYKGEVLYYRGREMAATDIWEKVLRANRSRHKDSAYQHASKRIIKLMEHI